MKFFSDFLLRGHKWEILLLESVKTQVQKPPRAVLWHSLLHANETLLDQNSVEKHIKETEKKAAKQCLRTPLKEMCFFKLLCLILLKQNQESFERIRWSEGTESKKQPHCCLPAATLYYIVLHLKVWRRMNAKTLFIRRGIANFNITLPWKWLLVYFYHAVENGGLPSHIHFFQPFH